MEHICRKFALYFFKVMTSNSNSSKGFIIKSSCPCITSFYSLEFPIGYFLIAHVYYRKSENADKQKENQV